MNAPQAVNAGARLAPPPLHELALAALVDTGHTALDGAELTWLHARRLHCGFAPVEAFHQWEQDTPAHDARLLALARELRLTWGELIAVALAAAVEHDAMVGRVVAWWQAPAGGPRPSLGLIDEIARALGLSAASADIVNGQAIATGLLQWPDDSRPLPELTLKTPVALAMALRGQGGHWGGVRPLVLDETLVVASIRDAARQQARGLVVDPASGVHAGPCVLVVRSGHPREARNAAALVAQALERVPVLLEDAAPTGLGPWLWLTGSVPVVCAELAPGETRRLPALPGHSGPVLVASGPDGSFEWDGDTVGSWSVPVPGSHEREALWRSSLGPGELAGVLGRAHRYDAAQIQMLARTAHQHARAQGADVPTVAHVRLAARAGVAGELGSLAERLPQEVPDEALLVTEQLRTALASFLQRCAVRERLVDGLGVSARTRYSPGVRGLFVGPSGTGKTLAAGWLATKLGVPLYRVDLASVSSKYIGETEKNLARLFARAERTEAVLLFDEADALFGKRTEVKESNDRFANAQTNYLLQRIESFEGIVILTSNSRTRFDSAFTRRLDAILEFAQPSPEERRALWLAHLGEGHTLSAADINRLACLCDLAGGHIRNVVLSAAVSASRGGQAIGEADVMAGLVEEYRKLGKQLPNGLARGRP